MTMPKQARSNRAVRRPLKTRKPNRARFAYRISEWSALTGTSRQTTWRAIKNGTLKTVDYHGITLVPDSERARLGFDV